MDIAEIRKKAKAGKSPGVKPGPTPPEQDVAAGVDPENAEPGAASDTVDLPVPAGAVPAPAVPRPENALDRLFAESGELQLATEESYHEALAAQGMAETQHLQQYLAFQLGREEYALDIKRISEIIKVRELTEVPRAPGFILGIISLRGVVVPVFDLKQRFKLGETIITSASRVVVCQQDDVIAGLLVDGINQVITLAEDRIEPPPAVLSGIDRDLVEGVGRYQGRMIIVLHLASVLDVEMA